MNIKMIVTDLDNTLLRRDKTISDYTVSVFERVKNAGITVVFATSRSETASARFTARIAPDIFISNGGALARRGESTLFSEFIAPGDANAIIAELVANTCVHGIAVEAENGYFNSKPVDPNWSGWIDYKHAVHTDFSAPIDMGGVFKIVAFCPSGASFSEIVKKYENLAVQEFSGEDWRQVKLKNINKAITIAKVAADLGIKREEIVSFGDDLNDIEMLKYTGTAVAVANAVKEVYLVADYICDDCDADGVAEWLEVNVL